MSGTLPSAASALYTTQIPTAHATVAVVLETPPPPPIAALLPYVVPGISLALSFLRKIATFLFEAIYIPIPLLIYLLEPVTTFINYLVAIFLLAPYTYGAYITMEIVRPLYVFCGVACLTGVLLGLLGRTITAILVANVLPAESNDPVKSVIEREGRSAKGKGKARSDEAEEETEEWSDESFDNGGGRAFSSTSKSSLQRLPKSEDD